MLKIVACVSAIALTYPAAAQVATDVAADVAAEAPVAADAALGAEVDANAPGAPGAAPAAEVDTHAGGAAEANDPAGVAAFVAQEFGNFDGDADGELNADEFAAWLVLLQEQQSNHTRAELDLWAQGAFAQADTDDSAGVSAAELTAFLTG